MSSNEPSPFNGLERDEFKMMLGIMIYDELNRPVAKATDTIKKNYSIGLHVSSKNRLTNISWIFE
jgi:hypothetical protein